MTDTLMLKTMGREQIPAFFVGRSDKKRSSVKQTLSSIDVILSSTDGQKMAFFKSKDAGCEACIF